MITPALQVLCMVDRGRFDHFVNVVLLLRKLAMLGAEGFGGI